MTALSLSAQGVRFVIIIIVYVGIVVVIFVIVGIVGVVVVFISKLLALTIGWTSETYEIVSDHAGHGRPQGGVHRTALRPCKVPPCLMLPGQLSYHVRS